MTKYNAIDPLVYPDQIFNLQGRTALLFGGAGKMGQQFARTLGLSGANVTIADIDFGKCSDVASELFSDHSLSVSTIQCDTQDESEIVSTISETIERHGSLDILIYNVMTKPLGYYAPFIQQETQTWNDVLSGNLTGAFIACREAYKHLKESNNASVILTSSTYGVVGPDNRLYKGLSEEANIYSQNHPLNSPASYTASKAGLIGLVRYLATLFGEHDIRVNALTPGGVFDGQEAIFENRYSEKTVLGRMATWSDYNGAILFLASDASRYMTGANLIIDGGWTAW